MFDMLMSRGTRACMTTVALLLLMLSRHYDLGGLLLFSALMLGFALALVAVGSVWSHGQHTRSLSHAKEGKAAAAIAARRERELVSCRQLIELLQTQLEGAVQHAEDGVLSAIG
ncbi:hypothetical protein, partial [Marinobacter sediminum]|uniref:hypothetical protein n=1 Tax=Marinobacter sediminum TaxID=256323 RepID=UPI0035670B8E